MFCAQVLELLSRLKYTGEVLAKTHDCATNVSGALEGELEATARAQKEAVREAKHEADRPLTQEELEAIEQNAAVYVDGESIPCCDHVLNTVVTTGLDELGAEYPREFGALRTKFRNLTTFFHHSSTSSHVLMQAQLSNGKKHALKTIADVITRWNSLFLMLTRHIQLRAEETSTLSAHPDKEVQKKLPGAAENIVAEELTTVLKPFYEATTALEGSVYPTLSLVHYLVVGITICLSNVLKNGTISQVVKVLAQKLQDKLLDKWINKLAKVSTTITAMLDIRTKDLNFFPRADRERMWALLEETAVRFHEAREAKGKSEDQAINIEIKQPDASSASEKGMDVWEVMSAFQCNMNEEDLEEPTEPAHDAGGLKSQIYLEIQDWRKVPSQCEKSLTARQHSTTHWIRGATL